MATLAGERARRGAAVAVCLATVGLALLSRQAPEVVRLLAPNIYMVAGYWMPALVVGRDAAALGASRFEQWLARTDAALRPRLPDVPSPLAVLSETAYLLCYPV